MSDLVLLTVSLFQQVDDKCIVDIGERESINSLGGIRLELWLKIAKLLDTSKVNI